ncbi:uncharacterized protein LOC110853808 [Folsomia candida]|uniref:Gamma-interferon-inducible-lysosomal thiol reductase n=1 Tax=Folsomia candida TaxID=158441 RepID=A0A226DZK6_FOLCA|nr:uncharacterized protein LOC110853808 [Folsomia candida]OXA50131.1 Gamma-interferon-inducible-lysosomal thiol reductase [Folsomia candida]
MTSTTVPELITVSLFVFSTLLHNTNGENRVIYENPNNLRVLQGKNPIQMSVYYETLCPDSLHFLQNQLLPLLATTQPQPVPTSGGSAGQDHQPDFNPSSEVDIDSLLDIRLIPYGKAVTLENAESTKPYTFLCQHGPLECEGNKLHSCALDAAEKQPKTVKDDTVTNFQMVNFLICTMKYLLNPSLTPHRITLKSNNLTSFSEAALDTCFSEMSNSTTLKTEIESCIRDDQGQGSRLLKRNGDLTNELDPVLYFVPWLTFNGIWTKENLERGQKDINQVLCSLLTPRTLKFYKVLGCQKYIGEKAVLPKLRKVLDRGMTFSNDLRQPYFDLSRRDGRGIVESRKIQRMIMKMRRPTMSPQKNFVGERTRGRRAFLHGNNDMGLSQGGGPAWRLRTNMHGNSQRWRKPLTVVGH